MAVAFPGESAEYRAARDRLLEQEIELRRAMEAVAASRRALPPGGPVPEDYVFHGPGTDGAGHHPVPGAFEPNLRAAGQADLPFSAQGGRKD